MLFLNILCSVLQKCCVEEYLFLAGDFNCTVSNLDRNYIEPHLPSCKWLIQLVKIHELCVFGDAFMRHKHNTPGLMIVTV